MITDPLGLATAIRELHPTEVRSVRLWRDARLYVDLARHFGRSAPCVYIDLRTREAHTVNWKENLRFHKEYGPVVDSCIRLAAIWPVRVSEHAVDRAASANAECLSEVAPGRQEK